MNKFLFEISIRHGEMVSSYKVQEETSRGAKIRAIEIFEEENDFLPMDAELTLDMGEVNAVVVFVDFTHGQN